MLVLVERRGAVAIVTLNRPEAMNALSQAMRVEIARVFRELDADDSVRSIVFTGAGKAFTAGLDLKELGAGASVVASANPSGPESDPVQALGLCRKPIIGAINGVAITGGFELALGCDILYASTNARFADTHARVGIRSTRPSNLSRKCRAAAIACMRRYRSIAHWIWRIRPRRRRAIAM